MDQLENGIKIPFLQVQNALIDDTEHFDKFEKWVWIVLARHAFGGKAYPSQKTIADKVGISDRKVRDCLLGLRTKGWLERAGINEQTQTVIWRVVVPDEIEIKWMEQEIERRKAKSATMEPVRQPEPKKADKPKEEIPYKEIIDYLNEVAGTKFKHTSKANQKHISGRWNEGNGIDDFKHVIDVKVEDWAGTKWETYLRPETLFGSKFESYLSQKRKGSNNGTNKNSGSYADEIGLPF